MYPAAQRSKYANIAFFPNFIEGKGVILTIPEILQVPYPTFIPKKDNKQNK